MRATKSESRLSLFSVFALLVLAFGALYSPDVSAGYCTQRTGSHSDPNTGQSWSSVWYCGNDAGAKMYAGANYSTHVAYMDSTNSWFVCYRRGEQHAGGNNVWYYSQGDRSASGWSGRSAWGYIPAINMWTSVDPNPGIPECRPDMWQTKLNVSDPNTGKSWSTVWYSGNDGGVKLYRDPDFSANVGYMDSTTSWFVCYARGVVHGGGNDVWYYTQGDRSTPGWQSRQAWGYMPAVNVHTRKDPYDSIPPCSTSSGSPQPQPPISPGPYVLPLPYNSFAQTISSLGTNHWGDNYWAIDLMVPQGTAVYSVSAGVVSNYSQGTCGNGLTVLGDDGLSYLYCHGSSYANVRPGERVFAGQLILYSGNTGQSGAPHLHLEIKRWIGDWNTSASYCSQRFLRAIYDGKPQSPINFPATSGDCRASSAGSAPGTPAPLCTMQAEYHRDPLTGKSWNNVWYCGNTQGALIYPNASFRSDGAPTHLGYMNTSPSWFVCYTRGDWHSGGNNVWYYTLGDGFSSNSWKNGRSEPWGYMPANYVATGSDPNSDPYPGVPECTGNSSDPAPTPNPPLQSIKVLQWNIAGGAINKGADGTQDGDIVKVVYDHIKEWQPDIVSLNEVCESQYRRISDLLRNDGWRTHFYGGAPAGTSSCSWTVDGGPEGVMLLSKVPTSAVKGHIFKNDVFPFNINNFNPYEPPSIYRNALCLTAQFNRPVRVCTMHLYKEEDLALAQAKAFMNYFQEDIRKRHYLLIGDFNLNATSEKLHNLMYAPAQGGNGFFYEVDYRGCSGIGGGNGCFTFPSYDPAKKIDYIFGSLNGFGRPTFSTVFTGDYWIDQQGNHRKCEPGRFFEDAICSDHHGLVGTLPLYELNDGAGTDGPYWYANVGAMQKFQVIDIDGPSMENGRAAQLWSWSGALNQRWYVKTVPGGIGGGAGGVPGAIKMISMYSNKCLDVQGPSANAGAAVHQWDCYDTRSQVWIPEPMGQRCGTAKGCVDAFRLRNYNAEYLTGQPMCLDAKDFGTSNGTRLQIWSCNGNANQLWYREHQ